MSENVYFDATGLFSMDVLPALSVVTLTGIKIELAILLIKLSMTITTEDADIGYLPLKSRATHSCRMPVLRFEHQKVARVVYPTRVKSKFVIHLQELEKYDLDRFKKAYIVLLR